MRGKNWRRMMSLLLAIAMLITSFPMQAMAAETKPTVQIVSFNRGAQADLRASELLEARVTGYDGNVQELKYEWKNELGTYLYVYNSHNMYGIDDTDGEVEISNKNGLFSTNTFSGIGFAWAAVYGAYRSAASALAGTITVIVRDSNGKELCRDTHTGTVKEVGNGHNKRYEYSGFKPNDLGADIGSATIGLFEGDDKEIKDLFGEAAITHITCEEAVVSNPSVAAGSGNYIELNGTTLTAKKATENAGDAKITFSIKKNNCNSIIIRIQKHPQLQCMCSGNRLHLQPQLPSLLQVNWIHAADTLLTVRKVLDRVTGLFSSMVLKLTLNTP